jgi:hypothetical protein
MSKQDDPSVALHAIASGDAVRLAEYFRLALSSSSNELLVDQRIIRALTELLDPIESWGSPFRQIWRLRFIYEDGFDHDGVARALEYLLHKQKAPKGSEKAHKKGSEKEHKNRTLLNYCLLVAASELPANSSSRALIQTLAFLFDDNPREAAALVPALTPVAEVFAQRKLTLKQRKKGRPKSRDRSDPQIARMVQELRARGVKAPVARARVAQKLKISKRTVQRAVKGPDKK